MAGAAGTRQEGIVGVFSRAAATYDRIGPQCFAHFGQRLVERAHLTPGADVLDVAAGRGAILFAAAQQVGPSGQVRGIDFSADMVRRNPGRHFTAPGGSMSRCSRWTPSSSTSRQRRLIASYAALPCGFFPSRIVPCTSFYGSSALGGVWA